MASSSRTTPQPPGRAAAGPCPTAASAGGLAARAPHEPRGLSRRRPVLLTGTALGTARWARRAHSASSLTTSTGTGAPATSAWVMSVSRSRPARRS
jgi:hypothetical protein